MKKFLRSYFASESGAVSVDWVVMTAGACGLALSTILIMKDGPVNVGDTLGTFLANSVSTN